MVPDRLEDLMVLGVISRAVGILMPNLNLIQSPTGEKGFDRFPEQRIVARFGEYDVEMQFWAGAVLRWVERVVSGRSEPVQIALDTVLRGQCRDGRLQSQPGVGQLKR